MVDPTEWPSTSEPLPGEVIVSATDLTDDEVLCIKTISSESAQYIGELTSDMSDEDWSEVVSQVYAHATALIEEKTGIRVDFQFRIAPEQATVKVRCFSFRKVH